MALTLDFPGAVDRAKKAIEHHSALMDKEIELALNTAANAAQRAIRKETPQAKSLPTGSHYTSGTPRKRGDLRKAVYQKRTGMGTHHQIKVVAGGLGSVVVPGAKAHIINTKSAGALSFPANFTGAKGSISGKGAGTVAFARTSHPALRANPYLERGARIAAPAIQAIIDETGKNIVAALAREIEGR